MSNLLLFTPYVGDTLIANGIVKHLRKFIPKSITLANMTNEMQELTTSLGNTGVMSYPLSELMEKASKISGMEKEFHRYGKVSYIFDGRDKEELEPLIHEVLDSLENTFGIDSLIILHYSYPYALLGRMAVKRGMKVTGYLLCEEYENLHFKFLNGDVSRYPKIWSRGFIGDRLTKLLTGYEMEELDYVNLSTYTIRDRVTLFPTTRGKQPTVENWDTDLLFLQHNSSITPQVAYYVFEEKPELTIGGYTEMTFTNVFEMVEIIGRSKFIICNDSASFHLAWLTNTPAIVKLKGGFNEEWIPRWVKESNKYAFIPAVKMYEEEYMDTLKRAVEKIGVLEC